MHSFHSGVPLFTVHGKYLIVPLSGRQRCDVCPGTLVRQACFLVTTFIALCEGYLGIEPNFLLW